MVPAAGPRDVRDRLLSLRLSLVERVGDLVRGMGQVDFPSTGSGTVDLILREGMAMNHDTDPSEIHALELQALRLARMSPSEKLDLVSSHSRMVLALADADVQSQHPDWSARRVRIEASKRWLPETLHTAAFGAEMATWKP